MKITGTCSCPVGDAAGHEADACRANLCDDGSVLCVICGTTYPKMSPRMKRAWRAVAANLGVVPSVKLGDFTQPGTPAYDAACLSGYDPNLSTMVRASFQTGALELKFEYERENEHEMENSPADLGRLLGPQDEKMPAPLYACVKALTEVGFRIAHVGPDDMGGMFMTLRCGRPVGKMGFVIGVGVELHWPQS
ncbi:MAG: hypothetical protein K2X27_24350 [Candidatus Obscuribacterales bacterium]|nr:hypothetical protein [Candidatus Obscuribacterales bacterium]